jgi:cytochrome P450
MVTQVLCRLLCNPEYIELLRQEAEAAVAEDGWTKAGMDKMRKIDSFLRETQRVDVESIGLLASSRCFAAADMTSALQVMPICLTLRPFTFSNGVTVPADTVIALPVHAIHSDEEIYPNAETFDGSRFTRLRDEEGDVMWSRHQAITASAKLLTFGLGRHAW